MDKGLYGGLFALLGTFAGGIFTKYGWVPFLGIMAMGASLILMIDVVVYNRKIDRMLAKALAWREASDD